MSSKKSGLITGLVIGAGLGVLFAPKKGSETRAELAVKINELCDKLKDIEYDDVKKAIESKIIELKEELADLDKEKIAAIARKKAQAIGQKAEELYKLAIKKGSPILEKAADDVRNKAVEVLNNTANKLEAGKKKTNKKTPKVKNA